MLLAVTLIWGGTFVWMKKALNSADDHLDTWDLASVVVFMVLIRFLIGAVFLPFFSHKARSGLVEKEVWKGGTLLGLLMFGGFLTQMLALNEISPGVSAFLTSLYVVFTALIGLALRKHPLSGTLVVGVLLATFGAGFIDGPPHLTWGWGELLTVFSALLFAFHILATDSVTKKVEPMALTQASFIVVVIASTLTLLIVMIAAPEDAPNLNQLTSLLLQVDILIWLLLLGLLGSCIAILLLNIYQRHLHPVHAAIIYALEPLWATLYAITEGLNEPTFWLLMGGGVLLLGNILVESRARSEKDASNEE